MRLRGMGVLGAVLVVSVLALGCASAASADDWLPHPASAQWTYEWSDTAYNPAGTQEQVSVQNTSGSSFTLAWVALSNPPGDVPDQGTVSFQDTDAGLINTNWSSTPAPPDFPILCASAASCSNSLSSVYYNVIWGNRAPLLSEPLLQGTSWASTGGAQNDVASESKYLGLQKVTVPAFPKGVTAAVVRTTIAQAGALGDPYGSGTRTTYWVRGVGPVELQFDHDGGGYSPVTTAVLTSTNQTPSAVVPDTNYFPLVSGQTLRYRWTNKKHLREPEIEKVTVGAVENRTAQVKVTSVSGPMKVSGVYGYTTRLDGVTNIYGSTAAASLVKFPKLANKLHFFTPLDFMNWGYGPILPAYPQVGNSWTGGTGRDFQIYGVKGTSYIVGIQKVKVPAGTFQALVVKSVLKQPGHPFGSGTRISWFAPNRGLVKLVFDHGDGSVSTIELLK